MARAMDFKDTVPVLPDHKEHDREFAGHASRTPRGTRARQPASGAAGLAVTGPAGLLPRDRRHPGLRSRTGRSMRMPAAADAASGSREPMGNK